MNVVLCPCCLKQPYETCCAPYIEKNLLPASPGTLMRSRYTAYVYGNLDYIQRTMQGKAASDFDVEKTRTWLQEVECKGLIVLREYLKTPVQGFVSFQASYFFQGAPQWMAEKSEFHRIEGQWFYVSGKALNPHKRFI